MGIFKAFDRSPEAMAAGLDRIRQEMEAQVGQPIVAMLPGLAPPGALEAAFAGWGLSRRDHQATGGATDRKNHTGLLAVTADGWLRLYKTRLHRKGNQIVAEVRSWPPGQVRVGMMRGRATVGVAVDAGGGDVLGFEMVADQAAVTHLAEPFAAAMGVTIGT